jgi:hypothetical protein
MHNADPTSAGSSTFNTAVGCQALKGSGTPANNTGYCNTAIGNESLEANSSGSFNTALGHIALKSNTEGSSNTAIGNRSLEDNISGDYNAAFGSLSLHSNSSGYENSALGYLSLASNTDGHANTAIGFESLKTNISGYYNTAIGAFACYYTTSNNNTSVGYEAGGQHTFSNSTFVGSHAYPDDNGYTNCMALGYTASVEQSDQVVIGNEDVSSIGGYAGWSNFSDGRFKKNVREDVPGLVFITQLRPITYTLDVESLRTDLDKNRPVILREGEEFRVESPKDRVSRETKEKMVYTGFIAQEVESIARSIGYDFSGVDAPLNPDGHYRLRYAEFVVPLVKAIQEQQAMIEELQEEVKRLRENQEGK